MLAWTYLYLVYDRWIRNLYWFNYNHTFNWIRRKDNYNDNYNYNYWNNHTFNWIRRKYNYNYNYWIRRVDSRTRNVEGKFRRVEFYNYWIRRVEFYNYWIRSSRECRRRIKYHRD